MLLCVTLASTVVRCRFSAAAWALAPNAQILDPEQQLQVAGKQFLVILMLESPLLEAVAAARHGKGRAAEDSAAGSDLDRALLMASTESSLLAFEQARQQFRRERRLHLAAADVCSWGMLSGKAGMQWQTLYDAAVKQTDFHCPVLIWHPKRHKVQVLSCLNANVFASSLERILDGDCSWTAQSFPASSTTSSNP